MEEVSMKNIKSLVKFDMRVFFKKKPLDFIVCTIGLVGIYLLLVGKFYNEPNKMVNSFISIFLLQIVLFSFGAPTVDEVELRENKFIKRLIAVSFTKVDYLLTKVILNYLKVLPGLIIILITSIHLFTLKILIILFFYSIFVYITLFLCSFTISQLIMSAEVAKGVVIVLSLLVVVSVVARKNYIFFILPFNSIISILNVIIGINNSEKLFQSIFIILVYITIYVYIVIKKFKWE